MARTRKTPAQPAEPQYPTMLTQEHWDLLQQVEAGIPEIEHWITQAEALGMDLAQAKEVVMGHRHFVTTAKQRFFPHRVPSQE
jgi:hypothetical protein